MELKKIPNQMMFITFIFIAILCYPPLLFSYPLSFIDAQEHEITVNETPSRVVSLVPSITEIVFRIGAGDSVKAITYHSTYPPETTSKEIVGGFFSPSLKAIEATEPDVVFYSRFHKAVMDKLGDGKRLLIELETGSIADGYENILLLGRIFNKEKEAAELVAEIKDQLDTIAGKVARIPQEKKKRVIRLMGRDRVMTPGDDSFQTEMIKAAGGKAWVSGLHGLLLRRVLQPEFQAN